LAEQGNASAQFKMSGMYYTGKGVIQNYSVAHMWLNIAASQGYKDTEINRKIVEKKITPAQIAEAQRMAREWVAKHQKELTK